jgi:hypothetical protein
MDDLLTRIVPDVIDRLHGPFAFRFVLQPLMAAIYAVHDGIADAREGSPAYFWSVLTHPVERWELLHEGWNRVARVIVFGVVMGVLYQLIVFKWIYPFQLVVIVIVLALAFVPYLLLRGPVNRIAVHWVGGTLRA